VGGPTIDWVMKTKGVSFRHAVELLRADHVSLLTSTTAAGIGRVVHKGTTAKLEAPVTVAADDQEALRQVLACYHETLKESPEALRYPESRGLTNPEMPERFQLGFANRTLGYRLPDKNRKEGAEIRGHADLKATQIYTHVAIRQLQEIHRATHPAKLEREKREIADALAGDDPDE
jgi:DNA primase